MVWYCRAAEPMNGKVSVIACLKLALNVPVLVMQLCKLCLGSLFWRQKIGWVDTPDLIRSNLLC